MDLVAPGGAVAAVAAVAAADDAPQAEGIRDLVLQLAGALGDATRRRALDVLRVAKHNRYKDRAPDCGVNSRTCMDSSTANCSRRSLGVFLKGVEVLPPRVMFPERLLWFCRLLFTKQMRLCAFRKIYLYNAVI